MTPEDINLADFSHLNFAFATFDLNNFEVGPESEADEPLFKRFTDRQIPYKLEMWISVGGGSFGAQPWQVMTSTQGNRAKFIDSLTVFMEKYGFQGVDLDYEFPRNSDDRDNYIVSILAHSLFQAPPEDIYHMY